MLGAGGRCDFQRRSFQDDVDDLAVYPNVFQKLPTNFIEVPHFSALGCLIESGTSAVVGGECAVDTDCIADLDIFPRLNAGLPL